MLLSLHLNVWRYKCINISIYFYMSHDIQMSVCVRAYVRTLHALWQIEFTPEQMLIHIFPARKAVALHQKTVSICWLLTNTILNLTYLPFLSLPLATDKCLHTHTHTHTCTCMRVHLMIVYPINCRYFGEGVLEWERWV